jgi:3-oxoacyl-[acyl-carrier protein] reductase
MHPTTLKGRRALVTGGSRGIGAAIALRLAREGADVALTYVSRPDEAQSVAKGARELGVKGLAIAADAADPKAVAAAVDRAAKELGGLDILVNNAGIAPWNELPDFALADFDRAFAVNVRSVFVATQAALRHMQPGGRVVTIGSCNAERIPIPGGAVYAMTKAALVGLVKGLARDLGPRGITINNVQPGPVATDMNPPEGEFARSMHDLMAIRRHAEAEEVAAFVAFVVGPEAAFVTGASLTIDGGFTA